jgi:hypothetical protein
MTPRELVALWTLQARASQKVHYEIGSRLTSWNRALTLAVGLSSAFVGSSLFGLLNGTPSATWKLALACVSAAAAALVAIQHALGLEDEAARHRVAGSLWQRILNKATVAMTYDGSDTRLSGAMVQLEQMIDDVVKESPQIPERRFNAVGLDGIYETLVTAATEMLQTPPSRPSTRRGWRRLRGRARANGPG